MSTSAPPPRPWYQLPIEEAARSLLTHPARGLTAPAAAAALATHGPNRITTESGPGGFLRFLRQFHQPLVYLLLLAVGVTLALQEWIDAAVILAVVMVNAAIGFLQESKAEKAIAALGNLVPEEATVIRDGQPRRLRVAEIVPGDLVSLEAGDKVPADLRLVHTRSLRVEEAMLTGESVPVGKHTDALAGEFPLAERKNSVFAGSLITAGVARGLVVATGNQTETGRIAGLIAGADNLATPLTRQIARFSRLLMIAIVVVAGLAFWIGVLRGNSAFDMFMAAVALAVGAIPEGLPAAVTITLAIGVSRMAKRRAIIRKLPAVETLGSTTVICSDKTGTLTRNEMTVQSIVAGGQIHAVSGVGYAADGHIEELDTPNVALHATLLCGLLCNDARLIQKDATHAIEGDPTEAALLVAAAKGGLAVADIIARHPRIDVIPFASEQQYMASLNEVTPGGERTAWIKGSMERLLPRCTARLGSDGAAQALEADALHAAADRQAARGLRVLLFARKRFPASHGQLGPADLEGDLEFLGLQAMMDPPRTEAVTSVRNCHRAGIRVKMITGDNLITARAIAAEIGLGGAGVTADQLCAFTGKDLAALSPEALADAAERATVFARVEPEQKLRLVQALQGRNHVVAMTGDGVNDAPALRQANIGVAMGITGTDVAKGAADMLLTDDNFASIEAAVEEGRGIFDNLTKFIVWTLPTNAGEAMILLLAIAMGTALPALPLHLLWINMTTAVLLGLMLVFEPKESGLMNRPPRDPRAPLINLTLFIRTGLVAICMTVGAFGLFNWELSQRGASLAEARSAVVNVIIAVEMVYLFNCRSLTQSVRSLGWFTNPILLAGVGAMVLLQLAFTYLPLFNRLFHTAPLRGDTWLVIGGIALVVFLIVGIEKWVRSRLNPTRLIK
jgi:cation-transporting P-type ATPase F